MTITGDYHTLFVLDYEHVKLLLQNNIISIHNDSIFKANAKFSEEELLDLIDNVKNTADLDKLFNNKDIIDKQIFSINELENDC